MKDGQEVSPLERKAIQSKDEAILALLAKLSLHYWRPDFTPQQAKQLYRDYLEDLRPYAIKDLHVAIGRYRQNAENRFFPRSGQLVELIKNDGFAPTDVREWQQARESAAVTRGNQEMICKMGELEEVAALSAPNPSHPVPHGR